MIIDGKMKKVKGEFTSNKYVLKKIKDEVLIL
jgi:hypothetical protein